MESGIGFIGGNSIDPGARVSSECIQSRQSRHRPRSSRSSRWEQRQHLIPPFSHTCTFGEVFHRKQ